MKRLLRKAWRFLLGLLPTRLPELPDGTLHTLLTVLAVLAVLALVAFAAYLILNLLSLIAELSDMEKARDAAYPDGELPPVLRSGYGDTAFLSSSDPALRRPDSGEYLLLDPEAERRYPYYRRTRHLVSDGYTHPDGPAAGHWYGFDEWVQDLLCGHGENN